MRVIVALLALAQMVHAADNFPGNTLTGTSGTTTGTTVGRGSQAGEPATYGGNPITSDWFSWTAPSSGYVTMATCNRSTESTTQTDTTLQVFTGGAVNSLTLVQSNDDSVGCESTAGSGFGSSVAFTATAGTTYRIQVDTYGGSATGTFVLHYGLAALTIATTDSSATEGGDTAAFTVVPRTVIGDVTTDSMTVTIGTSSQCTFSPSTLTFTKSNWSTAQTVTVTAINDAYFEGTHSCSPASIVASASYNNIAGTAPMLTVNDNDTPSFTITKSANPTVISAPGTITYTITVDNNGTATLRSPVITDALTFNGSAVSLTSGPTLISGDSNSNGEFEDTETWVYSATFAVSQARIDTGGSFSNVATFDTQETSPLSSSAAVTTITQSPNYTIAKSQSSGPSPVTAAGGVIGYTITVANTGNVTLTSPTLTSDTFMLGAAARTLTSGPSYSGGDSDSDGAIDVGETWTYVASYTVPQADIDATGAYTNVAAYSTAQAGAKTSNTVTTNVTRSPSFTVVKSQFAGPSPVTAAGQTITYRLTVANTGNQTLTAPTVTSDTFQLGGSARTLASGPSYSSGDTDADGAIDLSETWIYTATYTVPQSDIDATGSFTNVAVFTTTQAGSVTSNTVTTSVTRSPSFTVVKSQSSGPSPVTAAGQVLGYSITVANTGNQSLTGLSITDTLQLGGAARSLTAGPSYSSGDSDTDGVIDVGETWIYAASYTVPQADIDGTGSFTNTATFDTTQTLPTNSNTVTTSVTRSPSFTVVKSQSSGPSPVTAAGQVLGYAITVANTGNQSLTGLSITDTLQLGGAARSLTAGPSYSSGDSDTDGVIDVGETWIYAASYSVPLADMNTGGSFTNTATYDTAQTAPQSSGTVTTAIQQSPALALTKSHVISTDGGTPGVADAGDVVTYTYTVSNTGNVTITNISVSDLHSGTGTPPVPAPASIATLNPAQTGQFTSSYQVTQADVDNQ